MRPTKPEKHAQTGFTLIELLIVIAIMGILLALSSLTFLSAQKKSRDLKRKQAIASVTKALEAYHNDAGIYPTVMPSPGQPFADAQGTIYMSEFPKDPSTGRTYVYSFVSPDGYYLYAALENTDDSDVAGTYAQVCSTTNTPCNYVVTSANIADPPTQ